jgi:hypothetical protein
MHCPYCQTEQPDPPTRFCAACGLAIPGVRPASWRTGQAQDDVVRCVECGIAATSRRCRGCGAPIRWPDGVEPPDEEGAPGSGPAPELSLDVDVTAEDEGEGEPQ